MTKTFFYEHMIPLQAYYGRNCDDAFMQIMFRVLQPLTEDQFKQAVNHVVKTFEPSTAIPFPLAKHFLEGCGLTPQKQAVNAVARVKKAIERIGRNASVNFNDRTLHNVIDRYGGWPEICNWGHKEWQIKERAFIEAYMAALTLGQLGPKYVVGVHEKQNAMNGFSQWIEPPVCIKNPNHNLLSQLERKETPNAITD